MPVILAPSQKTRPVDGGAGPKQELDRGSGVIVYAWDPETGSLDGTFVLALYDGELARETGSKTSGEPQELPGAYDVTTFTPEGVLFAKGVLLIEPMGTAKSGAYAIKYILRPLPVDLEMLGYTQGTTLEYNGVGYQFTPTRLAIAWDNNVYSRTWRSSTGETVEFGLRGSAAIRP